LEGIARAGVSAAAGRGVALAVSAAGDDDFRGDSEASGVGDFLGKAGFLDGDGLFFDFFDFVLRDGLGDASVFFFFEGVGVASSSPVFFFFAFGVSLGFGLLFFFGDAFGLGDGDFSAMGDDFGFGVG
jgi:hypothetical protein